MITFLVKFQSKVDYVRTLNEGRWIVYGHYLTIQRCSESFSTCQPFPTSMVVWIRLSGFPGFMYRKSVIRAIRQRIGHVIKLDDNTGSAQQGRFVRMIVHLDINKPFISRIKIDGRIQRIEYESLLNMCFSCGHYSHMKDAVVSSVEMESQTQVHKQVELRNMVHGCWSIIGEGRLIETLLLVMFGRNARVLTDHALVFCVIFKG